MRYALIKNGVVVEVRDMPDDFDPSSVAHKFDFRSIIFQSDPPFDPALEKLQYWEYTVNTSDVDAVGFAVLLSQSELDELVEQVERDIAKTFYSALKNGTGTQSERLQRAERVAARLLRDAYA